MLLNPFKSNESWFLYHGSEIQPNASLSKTAFENIFHPNKLGTDTRIDNLMRCSQWTGLFQG